MADDLGDDWWLDADKKRSKEAEVESERASASSSDENGEKNNDNYKPRIVEKTGEKRKLDETVDEDNDRDKPPGPKKKKKRKSKAEDIANKGVTPLTPDDFFTALKKEYGGKLSTVEWDEIELSAEHFGTCNDLTHTPNSFLRDVAPKWKKLIRKAEEIPGSPIMLLISSAAVRTTELNRKVAEFKGENCTSAKLFAKHMKLAEQSKFLRKKNIHIGIGTPNRMIALIENGSLKLDQLRYVILDWSWRDCKLRRMVEITEIRKDLFTLITKHIIPLCKKGSCKLSLL